MLGNSKWLEIYHLVIKIEKHILDLELSMVVKALSIASTTDMMDADDSIFIGHIYKINTPQNNLVDRGQGGNGCDFKFEIIE